MSKKEYSSDSIQILEGLSAVRKRPGMYIGSTDARGLHHLIWEIVDNSIDEALNGYGDKVSITLNKDGSITVQDKGRGIPVGKHSTGKSTLEVVFTVLHAGGKFSEEGGYKSSAGLHGVGASVVNALSKWVKVEVSRDGKVYAMEFSENGEKATELKEIGKSKETGTKVTFLPDDKVFSTTKFNYGTIIERCRESAFLLSGLELEVIDMNKDKHSTFKFDNGLVSFVQYINEDKKAMHEAVSIKGEYGGISVDCAIQYTDAYTESILSFANMVRTKDGGTHETGLKTAITKAVNDYARRVGILKEKDKNFDGSDIREGGTFIVSVGIPESLLQFESQTKSKLGSPVARQAVENIVSEKLGFYLDEHKEFATELLKKIQKAVAVREAARKARDDARNGKSKNSKKEKVILKKLADATSKDKNLRELFIVEGK